MARLRRLCCLAAVLALAGTSLASCGTGSAVAQARHACVDVHAALTIQRRSERAPTGALRTQLHAHALARLLAATPYAAAATSLDGSWNPLMTTIGEAERVPMANLSHSLTRLCRVADSTTPYL